MTNTSSAIVTAAIAGGLQALALSAPAAGNAEIGERMRVIAGQAGLVMPADFSSADFQAPPTLDAGVVQYPAFPLELLRQRSVLSVAQKPLHVIKDWEARFEKHLKTDVTVRGANGLEYHLSAQTSRLGKPGKSTAYIVFYRDGMPGPVVLDIRRIEWTWIWPISGGEIDEIEVEGQTFGVHLDAYMQDSDCKKLPISKIQVWPKGDKGGMVELTISEYFKRTGRAGYRFRLPAAGQTGGSVDVSFVYYRDPPLPSGGRSIAFMAGPPVNNIQRVPADFIPTDSSVLTAVIGGAKLGIRLAGPDHNDLEIYDLRDATPAGLSEIPLDTLVPAEECG